MFGGHVLMNKKVGLYSKVLQRLCQGYKEM